MKEPANFWGGLSRFWLQRRQVQPLQALRLRLLSFAWDFPMEGPSSRSCFSELLVRGTPLIPSLIIFGGHWLSLRLGHRNVELRTPGVKYGQQPPPSLVPKPTNRPAAIMTV